MQGPPSGARSERPALVSDPVGGRRRTLRALAVGGTWLGGTLATGRAAAQAAATSAGTPAATPAGTPAAAPNAASNPAASPAPAAPAPAPQPGERPIRVITPFAGGNTLDTALRQLSETLRRQSGQYFVIENKPGGSGLISAQALMQAPADGSTLLLANTSLLTVNPHTFARLPYDPLRSFRPLTTMVGAAMVFAANAAVPAATLKEWIAYAKAHPGTTSFASFTAGNSSHFAGVLLNQRAGIDMVHVPHNGTPPAVQNLVGGQVQTAFVPYLAVRPHIASGRVKVLATTGAERLAALPEVPTFKEEGFPDLEIYIWAALVAPAGTPDAVVQRLNADLVAAMKVPALQQQWAAAGFDAMPATPDEVTRLIVNESRRWAEAVRLSGFKAQE